MEAMPRLKGAGHGCLAFRPLSAGRDGMSFCKERCQQRLHIKDAMVASNAVEFGAKRNSVCTE